MAIMAQNCAIDESWAPFNLHCINSFISDRLHICIIPCIYANRRVRTSRTIVFHCKFWNPNIRPFSDNETSFDANISRLRAYPAGFSVVSYINNSNCCSIRFAQLSVGIVRARNRHAGHSFGHSQRLAAHSWTDPAFLQDEASFYHAKVLKFPCASATFSPQTKKNREEAFLFPVWVSYVGNQSTVLVSLQMQSS